MKFVNFLNKKSLNNRHSSGFALPTILIVSIIMLTVLVAAVSSAAAVRMAMVSQYYNQVSQMAADAGTVYANACLDKNNGVPQWSDVNPLKPNTDCSGVQLSGFTCPVASVDPRCYVTINDNIISTFSVPIPVLDINGKASDIKAKGTVNLVRTSNGSVWRSYNQNKNTEVSYPNIVTDGLIMNLDAGNPLSYSGNGSAWTDLSGNNNNVALMNGVTYDSNNGGSLYFDGVNDYGFGNPSLNTSNNFSVFAWIKAGNPISGRNIIITNNYPYQTDTGWMLAEQLSKAFFLSIGADNAYGQSTDDSITTSAWLNIGAVSNNGGESFSLYVNGNLVSTAAGINSARTLSNTKSSFVIGNRSTEFFKGYMGGISAYNRALSAAEVKQNFNATGTRYGFRSTVKALVVGGGGGGGGEIGGGGGGGGVLYEDEFPVKEKAYSVIVGAGGAGFAGTGAPAIDNRGLSGSDSLFDSLLATGGGGGGGNNTNTFAIGKAGGSGGGSAEAGYAAGLGITGQGNSGGLAVNTASAYGSGGGGGAGGAGGAGTSAVGGAGGAGVLNNISGSSVMYGSGGGGAIYTAGIIGMGASGAGNGSKLGVSNATAGTANRGGGGGGNNQTVASGNGGSGVVIISYPTNSLTAVGGIMTTSGGNTLHTFNISGRFIVGSSPRTSCSAILSAGESTGDGPYWIYPTGSNGILVYCDMTNDGGGWTLVLQNNSAVTTPSPSWNDSINGNNISGAIGSTQSSFDVLVGLSFWNAIGTQARVQVGTSASAISNKATYNISLDAGNYYALNLSNQNILLGGTAPGFYTSHNGKPFTTYDADHDTYASNCAASYNNHPWWYTACWNGNLFAGGSSFQEAPYWTGTTVYFAHGSIWLK